MQAVLLVGALSDQSGWDEQLLHVPTLRVANTPLILHSITLLQSLGVKELTVNMHHGASNVLKLMQNFSHPDLTIQPFLEHRLLGSANVLQRLTSRPTEPFIVMMGDVFFEKIDIEQLMAEHIASGAAATVLVTRQQGTRRAYGLVSQNECNELVSIDKESSIEPDSLLNTGFYIFSPQVIDLVPRDRTFQIGRDLLPALVEAGSKVKLIEINDYYCRITDYQQYWRLNMDITISKATSPVHEKQLIATTVQAEKKLAKANLQVNGPVVIGQNCKIEPDVVIRGPSVIGNNVHIKRGARLDRVVVMDHTTIGLATNFDNSVIAGEWVANITTNKTRRISNVAVLRSNLTSPFTDKLEQLAHSLLALIILILFIPVFLLLMLAIKLESKGPIFYTQLRVGQRRQSTEDFFPGRVFVFIKFRTMYTDADARLKNLLKSNEYDNDTFVKLKHDPRITRVGRFIRKTSLDELPQLINVIRGDMRLVGNRPLPLYEASKLTQNWQKLRFDAPVGMTGLWQVSGRSSLSLEERVILDNYYSVTRSFWSDMIILLKTVPAVILQRGAF